MPVGKQVTHAVHYDQWYTSDDIPRRQHSTYFLLYLDSTSKRIVREKHPTGLFQCCGSGSRIRDPVPFCPPDPGSGIGFFRIPDPTIISESLKHFFYFEQFFHFLFFVSDNLKNGLFRGEIFFKKKKITSQKGRFSKMIKCATVMSQDLFQQERKATKR